MTSKRLKLSRFIFGFIFLFWRSFLFAEELTKCENNIDEILPVSKRTLANINYLKSTSQFPTTINPEIIKIKSKTVISDDYISFFYPAKKPKGLLVFIHGGGCNRILDLLESTSINSLELNKYMYLEGYSILLLGHAIGINDKQGNENVRKIYSELSVASRRVEVTKIHLQRITDAISQARESFGKDLPIYVLGKQTRPHDDLDISFSRSDQHYFQEILKDCDLKASDPPGTGILRSWKSQEYLEKPVYNLWCRKTRSKKLLTNVFSDSRGSA